MPPVIKYVGDSELAAPYKTYAENLWNQTRGKAIRWIDDIIIEVFNYQGGGYILFITEEVGGLIFTPRSGALEDTPFYYGSKEEVDYTPAINGTGWLPQQDGFGYIPFLRTDVWPVTEGYDDAVVFTQADDTYEFVGSLSNYGNLHWVDAEGANAVSWKGTPTRLFRDPYNNYAATFAQVFYLSGIATTAPAYDAIDPESGPFSAIGYVLGASRPNGTLYVVGYHRMFPVQIIVSKQGDDGWVNLAVLPVGYDGLPWLPSEDGLTFVHVSGAYFSIGENDTITFVEAPTFEGTSNETADLTFTKDYAGEYLFESAGSENVIPGNESSQLARAVLEFTQRVHTINDSDGNNTETSLQASMEVVRTSRGQIVGDEAISAGKTYAVDTPASFCEVNWSVPGAVFTGQGTSGITITSVSGCGTGSITATLQGGGNDGVAFSKEVLFPSGIWVYDHCVNISGAYADCSRTAWPPYSPCYCTIDSHRGGAWTEGSPSTRIVQYWSNITTFLFCTDYPPNPGKSCPEGWSDRAGMYDVIYGCYGDAGFTGGCCNCLRHDFDHYYRWVCP